MKNISKKIKYGFLDKRNSPTISPFDASLVYRDDAQIHELRPKPKMH